jgi:hypothetical protein
MSAFKLIFVRINIMCWGFSNVLSPQKIIGFATPINWEVEKWSNYGICNMFLYDTLGVTASEAPGALTLNVFVSCFCLLHKETFYIYLGSKENFSHSYFREKIACETTGNYRDVDSFWLFRFQKYKLAMYRDAKREKKNVNLLPFSYFFRFTPKQN